MIRSVLPALILSRLWIAFFVYLGHFSHPYLEKIDAGYAGVANRILNPWTTFDSQHFLAIAASGYAPKTTPFFPLYPLSMRPFGPNPVAMALAGVIISNLCFAAALVLLWRLTREIYGETVAKRAVWLLAFFPAGAFGMAVYTESLFLLLALGAFWCARRQKWLGAALWVTGAALTRNSGPILSLALLAEWFRTRKEGQKPTWSALLAMGAPALAFFGMQAFFRARFGAKVSSISTQTSYFRAPGWPTTPLWRDFQDILSGRALDMVTLLNFGATLLGLWMLWRFRSRISRGDAVFLSGVLLVHLTLARTIPPFTNGSLRYVFSTWPFTQLLALQTEKLFANRVRVVAFSAIYGLLCAVHSYLFGLKSFLG